MSRPLLHLALDHSRMAPLGLRRHRGFTGRLLGRRGSMMHPGESWSSTVFACGQQHGFCLCWSRLSVRHRQEGLQGEARREKRLLCAWDAWRQRRFLQVELGHQIHPEPGTDPLPFQQGQWKGVEQVLVVSIEEGYLLSLEVQVNPDPPRRLGEGESCVVWGGQSPVLPPFVEKSQDPLLRTWVDWPLPLHGLFGHPHCPGPSFLHLHVHLPEVSPRDKSLPAQDAGEDVISLGVIRHSLIRVSTPYALPARREDELGMRCVLIQRDVRCGEKRRAQLKTHPPPTPLGLS